MRSALAALAAAIPLLACGCDTGGVVCNAPLSTCGDSCANLDVDPMNCGGCGKACATGQACVAGACTCAGRTETCGSVCVDTVTDPSHCGGCGKACGPMQLCDQGACVSACAGGKTECGKSCVDVTSDPRNCGGCGEACPQGQSCVEGACKSTVVAACFNTGEVVALDDDLVQQPKSALAGAGPQALAFHGGKALVADTMDDALYRYDLRSSPPAREAGGDRLGKVVNQVLVRDGKAYAVNSGANNVQVIDLGQVAPAEISAARTIDQIPTAVGNPPSAANTNPSFAAFAGEKLFVTLLGTCSPEGHEAGNKIVELEVSKVPGKVARVLQLNPADYEKDGTGPNSPRPGGLAAVGTRLYVAIGNLNPSCVGSAGPGYLDIVDTATEPMTVKHVKLPDGCRNPAHVLAGKDRVYVACPGAYGWAPTPQEALVVLDLEGKALRTTAFTRCEPEDPADGPNACRTAVPGRMTLRGDRLIVSDGNAGRLFVTDLDGAPLAGKEKGVRICPLKCSDGDTGCYQYTSDVAALR